MGIDPQLWLSLVEERGARCEWWNGDDTRCQNTMSLKSHHRTYDRYGHETLLDLSLLCPAHHMVADAIRKALIGQRKAIIIERSQHTLEVKFRYMEAADQSRFADRLTQEFQAYGDNLETIRPLYESIFNGRGQAPEFKSSAEGVAAFRRLMRLLYNNYLCAESELTELGLEAGRGLAYVLRDWGKLIFLPEPELRAQVFRYFNL